MAAEISVSNRLSRPPFCYRESEVGGNPEQRLIALVGLSSMRFVSVSETEGLFTPPFQ